MPEASEWRGAAAAAPAPLVGSGWVGVDSVQVRFSIQLASRCREGPARPFSLLVPCFLNFYNSKNKEKDFGATDVFVWGWCLQSFIGVAELLLEEENWKERDGVSVNQLKC